MTALEQLQASLTDALGERIRAHRIALNEITIELAADDCLEPLRTLRDDPRLRFEQLIDLCGVDYSTWRNEALEDSVDRPAFLQGGRRFASVLHLLSVTHNWRVRVRVFATDNAFPVIPSVNEIWPAAGWYEREAFDLYGIVFDGHLDLRRLLTDYGFIGHPFRKDFPVSGYVEMRYDPEQKRVIYQPVTIEPRENVQRVVREDVYGQGR